MNEDIRKKWIEALRSGKYQQTTGALRKADGMCCLGVLCDIVDPKGWKKLHKDEHIRFKHYGNDALPSARVYEKAGIDTTVGNSPSGDDAYIDYLATENDNGKTFEEIADMIEKQEVPLA